MSLVEQVTESRKLVHRDGYDMSFGEIASLYERGELIIHPEYQRLFRWDSTQKTRFIESLLLNIPIPPIFVFADEDGKWELVDGLQRISTVLEFMGLLRKEDGSLESKSILSGTSLLPALEGTQWSESAQEPPVQKALPSTLQIAIRRGRIRVEILSSDSDARVKYELFQRLNTGGANLSEQEVRNCVIIAINREAYRSILNMSVFSDFVAITDVGQNAVDRQFRPELVVRFLVLRHHNYRSGMDVHEYLDQGISTICSDKQFDWSSEEALFKNTMTLLNEELGANAFKKNNRFSLAFFEFIALGLSKFMEGGSERVDRAFVIKKISEIPHLREAETYTGIGVRGTTRLSRFVTPLAVKHFKAD